MTISCKDREKILLEGAPEELAELASHATGCESCAAELQAWRELSIAAAELRDHQENPVLWTRIEASLAAQMAKDAVGKKGWALPLAGWRPSLIWQTALAGALAMLLLVAGAYLYLERRGQEHPATANSPAAVDPAAKSPFLSDRTLAEVERTENAYMQAIDKLAGETKPEMAAVNSPLMDSYREKLLVLDDAIRELRVQAGENPSNAHLRYQLLAMYREKQDTLQEILESKR